MVRCIGQRHVAGLLLAFTCLISAGCGDGMKVPPLAKVEGDVSLDGASLPEAVVIFQPVNSKEGPSQAVTDASGHYVLMHLPNHPGAVIGEHLVRISAKSGGAASTAEPVPPKYNEKSELKRTVEAGENTHDFELKSK